MRPLCTRLFLVLLLACSAHAAALPAEQREASVRFLQGLRNEDGGYRPTPAAGPSQVSACVSALRGIKYFGGKPQEPAATERFLKRCFDSQAGAYSDTPGGVVGVRPTALTVMALVELGATHPEAPSDEVKNAAVYLLEKPQSLPDIYIAEAALESASFAGKAAQWTAAFDATRNADGTYGKTPGETASAVITTLRLKQPLKERGPLVKALRAAQQESGGFGAPGEPAALPASYPMTRALFMLHEKPDLDRLERFVASCRNADCGYGPTPGQPSTGPTTYHASIILHWIEELRK